MSELKSEIGKRIASTRKEAGDSQEACAIKLGIKRGTLAAYENGTNATPDSVKKKFAHIYNISLQYLISGVHSAQVPSAEYKKSDILSLLQKMEPSPLKDSILDKAHQLIQENRNHKDKIIELLEKLNDLKND